ncbi:Glucuronoxylanase XynC precursor [compost metagenome]
MYDSKMLWALGNYSRFIKPGSQRVLVNTLSDTNTEVYVSAYKQNQKLVTVAVNPTKQDILLDIEIKGKGHNKAQTYVTSANYNLSPFKQYNSTRQILLPAESVTTILSK